MIDILLATFNGAAFIRQQLDSVLAQSYDAWRLLIRDDGSTDDTAQICLEYASKYPGKINIIQSGPKTGSASGNFNLLLQHATGDYVMFCDQDDVWLPQKVKKTLAAMEALERQSGAEVPAMGYTDVQVVDKDLVHISPSLMRHLNRNPHIGNNPRRLCLESPVYGNTVMINGPLRRLVGEIPEGIVCYDWWIALVAVTFGRLVFVNKSTSLFRRHGGTVSGAEKFGLRKYIRKGVAAHRHQIFRASQQCRMFHDIYGSRMTSRQRNLFAAAGSISESNWLMRRYLLLRHGLFKTGTVKNLGLLAVV